MNIEYLLKIIQDLEAEAIDSSKWLISKAFEEKIKPPEDWTPFLLDTSVVQNSICGIQLVQSDIVRDDEIVVCDRYGFPIKVIQIDPSSLFK